MKNQWELTIGKGMESRPISADKLFEEPGYESMESAWLPLGDELINEIRSKGWPNIETSGAHWMTKKRMTEQPRIILSSVPVMQS